MDYALGIDPGLDGAIAVIRADGEASVYPIPTFTIEHAQKRKKDGSPATQRQYDLPELWKIINQGWSRACATIEKSQSMPDQSAQSVFSTGKGYGILLGMLTAAGISFTEVVPRKWKNRMLPGMGSDKGSAVLRANQLWPSFGFKKKDHGKAEALLIARWGIMQMSGENNGQA